MPDQQCGLCLSCGAPFLPDITEVDFFNREGNLSMLFLNTQFQRNAEIQRMYTTPKLCSERQACHMFHRAYHQTALEYMCTRHTDDNGVGTAGLPYPPNFVIPRGNNVAFLYYHTATGNKGPRGAIWFPPAAGLRIDMRVLIAWIERCAGHPGTVVPTSQRGVTYDMCQGCNALMTQKSHMRFLLGLRNAGAKNTRGRIIPLRAYGEFNVEANRRPLEDAYGNWRVPNPVMTNHPYLHKSDSEAPAIAYYLHMCLPFQGAGGNALFHMFNAQRNRVKTFYLEMCWLILEIACLAILLEEGTVTKPSGMSRSHGMHQHLGVLDVYVSFFIWRLMRFEYGRIPSVRRIDFVQFHQKYFADAKNCPGLLSDADRSVITGRLVYSSSNQDGKMLVTDICNALVDCYDVKLQDMIRHCASLDGVVPRPVREYFLPVDVILTLRARSGQATRNDFQSALSKFGISALLFRLVDLCEGYPREFMNQLKDFRSSWQWREVERVRASNPGCDTRAAFRLYLLCSLLYPPDDDSPLLKELEDIMFENREYCSPWTAVMSLDAIGAFRYQTVDLPLPEPS